jgi:nucleoside-diphosphate-sugar epimerase
MNTLLCLGFGYCARELTRHVLPLGWQVAATYRRLDTCSDITATGAQPLAWGDEIPSHVTHVLVSAAPNGEGDPSLSTYKSQLESMNALVWVGYLSTTAVYGDHQGGWVDENTPVTPMSERGRWRAAAEQSWLDSGLPVQVFRLAGIYGPGRGPFEKVRNGTAQRVIKPGQVFSRIHVEDIARVLLASMSRGKQRAIWNVCDDLAAPPEDVIGYAAELLGLPLPPAVPFEDAEMTPMARSFYSESKRVRNDRMKRDLGVNLLYPTYREGLRAILKHEASKA